MKAFLICTGTCLFLSACTLAEWHSINRQFTPGMGDSRLIDAKQRAIISVVDPDGKYRGTCAEPSPDALAATAAALSGAGNISRGDLQAAFRAAAGSSESAASIGLRTQSIQLLRDAYYRICEGSLNGGLDRISYDILQRRFQNHMIALLAIEQLTGVVKAEQVALTSTSTADAGADLGALNALLREQREDLNKLKKRDKALDAEITKLDADIKKQGTPTEPEAQKKLEQDQALLASKKSDKATLAQLIADQAKVVANLQAAVEKASLKTISAGTTTSATRIGGGTAASSGNAAVSAAVTEITLAAINLDYSGQVCSEALRPRDGEVSDVGGVFLTFCKNLFDQLVMDRAGLTKSVITLRQADAYARQKLADAIQLTAQRLPKNVTPEQFAELLKLMAIALGSSAGASPKAPQVGINFIGAPVQPQ